MNDDSDFDLRPDQWETLKTLRGPEPRSPAASRLVLGDLIALGLITVIDEVPSITPTGRKALIRGSFRLLDAAA